jgi:Ni/Co efflux regulator RcnB
MPVTSRPTQQEKSMKNKMIAKAMIAVMLATSLPAIAQDRGYRDDRAQERVQERREERREDRRDYREDRRDARRDYREARREDRRDARDARRGAGPRHDLYRGQRLPSHYRNRQYVVDNWRSHRLSAPPRGHHWVQVGNDYVLAAIATGVIATVLLGN